MNWRNEAIERLRRLDLTRTSLQCMTDELKDIEQETVRLKTIRTDKTVVKSSQETTDRLMNILVRKEELRYALQQAKRWVKITERALGMLLPEERLVLHRFYVALEKGAVDRLRMELGCEQSTIYRKRDQALLRFTLALYGFTDTQFAPVKEVK